MLRVADQGYRTDTGRQRNANEDAYFARAPIFVVADGMGGAKAGEVASQAATEAFDRNLPEGPLEGGLRETIEVANREIHELARQDPSRSGMGTTLTAAIVDAQSEEVVIGHVGDSRAYRLRDGALEQLTRDHSLVEEMRRKGQLTDEQASDHPQRSIITRALGPEPQVDVDVQTVPARPGDVFLICSDGLTTMIDDGRISQVLTETESMDTAVRTLVGEANEAGGRDNITAVAFRLEEVEAGVEDRDRPTLVGPAAAEEGFTAEEVRRRATAERREREPAVAGGDSRLRRGATIGVAILLVGALVFGAWFGIRQIWFLGTDEGGRVALYRGLPYDLPFGLDLYEERYTSPLQTASLPPRRREAVTDHDLRSRSDAVALVEDIERSQGIGVAEEPPPQTDAPAPQGGDGTGDAGQPGQPGTGGRPPRQGGRGGQAAAGGAGGG